MSSKVLVLLSVIIYMASPIQLQTQDGLDSHTNTVEGSTLNQCLNEQKSSDIGYCFGKDILGKLNNFDEAESFSLATGVNFVRDEKTPRDFPNFLDKDPMDFRSMIEDASQLISKRSLQWDLSGIYPGLTMRVGPTLANGVLEFVLDPRLKDRTYNQPYNQPHGEISTGRLLTRNLLVPFLLGFKFQLSTLLPIMLGLVLLATKKAFLLAKVALLATTLFSGSSGYSNTGGSGGGLGYPETLSALSPYTSFESPSYTHGNGGFHHHHRPYHHDYYYREKSAEATTAPPITPDELRDRLERLFVTKNDNVESPREEAKVRNARNFAWTPLKAG